jgi:hypothetical protein
MREPTEGEKLLYDRIVMLEAEYNKERDRADKLAMALNTVGAAIYTGGRGTKLELELLSFIRRELGRE